jgi:hypothetical protein
MALRISTPTVDDEKVLFTGTLAISGILYLRCDCDMHSPATSAVDWRVKADKASTMLFYKSRVNATSGTLVLTDATAVDDGDTFVLNGLTFTAEATEGDATAATRKYWMGANNGIAAVNLTALLNDPVYGVPGVTFSVVAGSGIDTITAQATTAPYLQFGQGTSAANEVAWTDTTLTNLARDAAVTQVTGAATTGLGTIYRQMADGYPYCYLGYTSTDGAATTALTVGSSTHLSL